MRRVMPKRSAWRVMQFDTLRLRLVKLAAFLSTSGAYPDPHQQTAIAGCIHSPTSSLYNHPGRNIMHIQNM